MPPKQAIRGRGRGRGQNPRSPATAQQSRSRSQPVSNVYQTVNRGLPLPKSHSNGRYELRNREVVLAVSSTTAFQAISIPLHPGCSATSTDPGFVWLPKAAGLFSEYSWKQLTVEYIPSCPTTTAGNVVIAFSYDYNDPIPASLVDLVSLGGSRIFPPYIQQRQIHCNISQRKYRYTPRAVFDAQDGVEQNFNSVGRLIIGIPAMTTTTPFGMVLVNYQLSLESPTPLQDALPSLTNTGVGSSNTA